MKKILKWDVPVDDGTHKIGGGRVVYVGCQSSPGIVQVWTEEFVYPNGTVVYPKRMVEVVATGQSFNDSGTAVGSVITAGGNLVWHVVRW